MAPHDDHDQFHNQPVPPDDKEWITNIRKNKRSLLLHGLSNDNKKLELRLGPPGDHHDEDEGSPFDDEAERINHVNWLRSTFQCNTNIGQTVQQYMAQEVLVQPTKPSLNIISQKPSCAFLVNWDHDHHQLQISDQNKKPCPVPTAASTVSKFPNSSAPNCRHKRSTSTTAGRASVIGWPPIRSCRKNLNGSNSFSKTVALNITNNNYDHSGDESDKKIAVLPRQDQGKRSSELDHDHHMFVKINMEGVPIGRKVDLKAYDSYEKLSYAIDQLFRGLLAAQRDHSASESNEQTGNHAKTATNIGEYTLVYEDNEGDRMLVGDVPWKMFVSTAKRLRVLRSTELSTLKLSSSQITEKTPLVPSMEIGG